MGKVEKKCTKCGRRKLLIEFNRNSSTSDELYSWCKSCQRIYMRYWQETTSQEARTNETLRRLRLDRHERKLAAKRRSRIQHVYGITPEQYDKILEAQNYLCALCGCELTSEVVPSVDHCHKINEMRGIICRKCNLMLGLAEDNPKTLIMGARYLQQFS